MATHIVLAKFTDQGVRNVKQSPERAKSAIALGEKLGIKIWDIYWTLGTYDAVLIVDAPNEEAMTTWALSVSSLGNIRTQTMRAFSADEVNRILAKIPQKAVMQIDAFADISSVSLEKKGSTALGDYLMPVQTENLEMGP